MSSTQTQRVKNLIEGGYIKYWKQGFTPKEIAEIFQVCNQTVYSNLDKIAEMNGLTREDLMICPFKSGERSNPYSNPMKKEKANAGKIHQNFLDAIKSIEEIISTLNETLEDEVYEK